MCMAWFCLEKGLRWQEKNIFCNNYTNSIPNYPPKKKKNILLSFIHNHPRPKSKAPQKISCLSCQGTVLISVMRETPASMAPRRILKPSVKASESSMDPSIHGAANPSGWQWGKSSYGCFFGVSDDEMINILCICISMYEYTKIDPAWTFGWKCIMVYLVGKLYIVTQYVIHISDL